MQTMTERSAADRVFDNYLEREMALRELPWRVGAKDDKPAVLNSAGRAIVVGCADEEHAQSIIDHAHELVSDEF